MVTISSLRRALSYPATHFQHLKDLKWEEDYVVRSTYFAQTHIKLGEKRYLLCMPLRKDSLERIARFIPLHKHLNYGVVPQIELLRNEMLYTTATGSELYCDIMLEPMPDALPLADAIATIGSNEEAEQILSSINTLEELLLQADISHNNIRIENLLIDSRGAIYPIRWYYATEKAGGDKATFDSLREKITNLSNNEHLNPSKQCAPDTPTPLDKYLFAGDIHEGMIAVESEEGWGFVNYSCEEVIRPQYLWANDFCEGRAEVQTECGMGLIDKSGNYIIDPIYDDVEFDAQAGWSKVCKDQEWALFDYSGRQLCDWSKTSLMDLTQSDMNEII